jgi:hypothetical protein
MKVLCSAALLLASVSAASAAAPQGLLNKTVTLHWGTSGMAKGADGRSTSFSNINTRMIYISSAGRTFLRMRVGSAGRSNARQGELGPDDGGSRGSVRLEGNRLVGVESFQSGARQYVATFDASFASCTLTIIDAKGDGGTIRRRGPNGAMYEVSNVSTNSPSCSIQAGNAFGGQ